MGVPKHKISKSRGRKRRTHWKLETPQITRCPRCNEPVLPHRACSSCGYYRHRKVLAVAE
ncbi:MAG: 50S ribosomal protein L32 [Firmicutes bacterium]|nr:50S ribosomal protein L32 [Bacillota bacterium]